MMPASTPEIRPFSGAAIPQSLKDQRRWAPWRAVLNEKKQKYDKVPHRADRPEFGISTQKPEQWFTYEVALAAYRKNPDKFAGIGYVMTGAHGVIGVDLDRCVTDGVIAAWAAEVVTKLDSYTEISPSGRGLRILSFGEVPSDWNNHEIGIEIYGGNEARFLTVTGEIVPGAPGEVRQARDGVLSQLEGKYAKERRKADVIDLNMPELLDELLMPTLADIDLPYAARDFLTEGLHSGDRSRAVFSASVALYASGLSDAEVFTLLVENPFVMEIALDHRRQDHDRALLYIWREHCCKGKAKAADSRLAGLDDFDDVSDAEPAQARDLAPIKTDPFEVLSAKEFGARKPVSWLIKGILPKAELCVLFGDSGSGKTFFALDLVGCIARGHDWRGRRVRKGRVVYICAEGAGGFRNRMDAYAQHNGIDLADLDIGVIPSAPNLLEKADIKALIAAFKKFGVTDVIVVDTFAQSFQGNENSGEDMSRALAHCKALHRATGALVILVAHSGKDSSKGVRGWSGLRAAADAQIEVVRAGDQRAAVINKQKDGSGEGDEYGFKLDIVTLGQDEDGDDITSCVLQEVAVVPQADRKRDLKGSIEKIALQTARALLELTDGAISVNEWVEATINQIPYDGSGRDPRRGKVMKAQGELIAGNYIAVVGGKVTLT
ncbi:MAG: AAA family ATPase [Janthinobacterium lividum]